MCTLGCEYALKLLIFVHLVFYYFQANSVCSVCVGGGGGGWGGIKKYLTTLFC